MEEQEVLSTLKVHVARYQTPSPDGPDSTRPSMDPAMIDGLSAEVWNSGNAVGHLNPRNPGLLNEVVQTLKKMLQRSLSWYTRPLQVFNRNVAQAIEQHGRAINSIQRQLHDLPTKVALDEAFETARLATQEQQSPYVPLFLGLAPVVDLGCGRGEFLELLNDAGVQSYGVDSDPASCEVARRRLLTIVEGDLFQHLRQLPERSLGGVFCARLVEYLPTHAQPEFVALCSSRLKPGGRIVIETINPDSDSPFGRNWRLDPGHLHPVYPEILRSILESNGFRDSHICVLAPQAVPSAETGGTLAYSGNGRGGEIAAIPSVTGAPAYAAIGTRT
jgi:SAM-dependent methyltransferase